jgi:hypothetical protein
MSKKYKQIAIEKSDREAMIACLDYILKEFDRMERRIADAESRMSAKLTVGKKDVQNDDDALNG